MGNIFVWMVFLPLFSWTNQGPDGGYVGDIAIDYSDYVYAATNLGLFKGSPEGIWDDITPHFWGVELNEVAFVSRLWICTAGDGIYYLDGDKWLKAASNNGALDNADVLGIVHFSGHVVVATRGNGLWASPDVEGNTPNFVNVSEAWNFPSGTCYAIASSPFSTGNHLAVGFSNDNGTQIYVRESADAASPFNILSWPDLPSTITCLDFAEEGGGSGTEYLYIGTIQGVTYVSDLFSAAPLWQGKMKRVTVIYDLEQFGPHIYLSCYGGVYQNSVGVTDDWSSFNDNISSLFVYNLASKNTFVAAASDGPYKLSGSSGPWDMIKGLRTHFFTSLDIGPGDPNSLVVSSFGGGLYFSEDGGTVWGHEAEFTPFAYDEAVGGSPGSYRLYAAGSPDMSTSLDGNNWSPRSIAGGTSHRIACNPDNPDEVWFIVVLNVNPPVTRLYYSDDAGQLDDFQHSFPGQLNVTDIVYSPGTKMLFISDIQMNNIWRMTNPYDPTSLELIDFKHGIPVQLAVAGNNLYALTSVGDIYLSTDNASTWQVIPSKPGSGSASSIATDPDYPNLLLASRGGTDASVYATTDSAQSWVDLGSVPGIFECCDVMVSNDMGDTYDIEMYVATHRGVFSQNSNVDVGGGSSGEVLDLTITVTTPVFRPEIGEVAEFELGGRDLMRLDSWKLEIMASSYGAEVIYTDGDESSGPSGSLVIWDGYADDGYLAWDDEYRVIFSGSNTDGSGADTTYVELIIGRPPQSIIKEATRGNRKLNQYSGVGEICYLSRAPLEAFMAEYNPVEESYSFGYSISDSRDEMTPVVTTTPGSDANSWIAWIDEFEGEFLGYVWHGSDFHFFSSGDQKVSNMAIVISETGTPVIATTKEPLGGDFYYIEGSLITEGEFTEAGQSPRDLELVPASDGVHVLYIDDDIIHDAVWTTPGAGFDRSADPEIGNSVELTATSTGSGEIYLFYTSSGGELFLVEYSETDGWGSPYAMTPHLSGAQPHNITCTVDDAGDLTVAWDEDGNIHFIQRVSGTWSSVGSQTESGVASFPQLPLNVPGTDKPLISWTERTEGPYTGCTYLKLAKLLYRIR